MTEDAAEIKEKPTSTVTPEQKVTRTLFSHEEIASIVRGFTLAWLRGIIKIEFPVASTIQENNKKEGGEMSYKECFEMEVRIKRDFTNLVGICVGSRPSTAAELEESMNKLFAEILVYRAANRIEGEFMEYKMEERIVELEKKVEAANNLIATLVEWLTEEAKGNDRMP